MSHRHVTDGYVVGLGGEERRESEGAGVDGRPRQEEGRPGIPARREFEYRRHGTAVLFAGLDVHAGTVAGWVTDSTGSDNFVAFLADRVAQTPTGLDLHCIVDNFSAHSTPKVAEFLDANPHVHLHYTPTHASWLNQVELFFSILERRLLRRGEFDSVDHLADRVIAFIKDYNRDVSARRDGLNPSPSQGHQRPASPPRHTQSRQLRTSVRLCSGRIRHDG